MELNQHLTAALNKVLREAAEPIIQQALAEAERKMREALAVRVMDMVRSDYSMMHRGTDLVITVRGLFNEAR